MRGKSDCFHVLSFGLAAGVVWGAALFLIGLAAADGYGIGIVNALSSFYVGYKASFVGSLVGGIWGFIDGFVMGVAFAWLYNYFYRRCCKCKDEPCEHGESK